MQLAHRFPSPVGVVRSRLPNLERASERVNDHVIAETVSAAAIAGTQFISGSSGWRGAAAPIAPRGRLRRPGAGPVCLVLMGDPAPVGVSGPRTLVRQCPSTRIPSPSPAAAAACLPTSGPPAFSARAAPRVARLRARQGSLPARRDASRHDPSAATPISRRCAFPRLAASLPSVVSPPSARYRGCGGPCLAMRRPPTLQRCSLALARHLV